jgi:putative flippase GtrA
VNPFVRWLRFNLVGAIGMGVQLLALAVLNRATNGRYLLATAAALEITLLHNFAWHVFYTWRDRHVPRGLKYLRENSDQVIRLRSGAASMALLGPLARFHLTNGLASLLGNLALMRLLVEGAHLPVLAANGIAILCCSILNFLLADRWAFVAPSRIRAASARSHPVTLSAVLPPAPD